MGILFLLAVIFWKKGEMTMKKLGLLLCLLLGLTACGQVEYKEKEEVFATLDEAIEAHLQQNPSDELEEICQIENAHIAVFTELVHQKDKYGEDVILDETVAYFVLYEEVEDGFVLREQTNGIVLDDTKAALGVMGEANWIDHADGDEVGYHLRGVGFGDAMPMPEVLEQFKEYGEIHERDGFFFAFALEVDYH
jgi:hypothetical protein